MRCGASNPEAKYALKSWWRAGPSSLAGQLGEAYDCFR